MYLKIHFHLPTLSMYVNTFSFAYIEHVSKIHFSFTYIEHASVDNVLKTHNHCVFAYKTKYNANTTVENSMKILFTNIVYKFTVAIREKCQ